MLRKLISHIRSASATPIPTSKQLKPRKADQPYSIRVSIPIKNEDDSLGDLRYDVIIENDRPSIHYGLILDAVCHLGKDPVELWQIENAMDTVIWIDRDKRGQFSKKISPEGLRCPIELVLPNKERVLSHIDVTVEE